MLDFIRLARAKNISYMESGHTHCREGWVQIQCPFCGSSGSHGGWYLGFALESGVFNCWRCGQLDFYRTITSLLRVSIDEAKNIVREFQKEKTRTARIQIARKLSLKQPMGTMKMSQKHREYLINRRFDPDHLEKEWNLLGTRHLSRIWNWRIIIPIKELDGRIVAYQGRSIGDGPPKYRMTEDADCLVDPDTLIYGLEKAVDDSVLVVEGCPGVWRLGRGTVGLFGIDWKEKQANRLRRFKNKYILFDPEEKAQERAHELAKYLSVFLGNTEVLSGFDTDPGDFSDARARKIRRIIGIV